MGTSALTRGSAGMRAIAACLASLCLGACVETDRTTDDAFSANGRVVAMSGGDGGAAHACFACHGLEGRGDGESAPRLAGLDAGYLHKQLEDYAAGLREDKVMQAVAAKLTPTARLAVAQYYAALAPAPAAILPAPVAYHACASCHGAAGEGAGPGGPALAGQPPAYLVEQMRRWRDARRRNDPRGVMRTAAAGASGADVATIAAWLRAPTASPPPGSAGATRSTGVGASE